MTNTAIGGNPTHVTANGTKEWRQEGKLHRFSGPAVIETDGTLTWCQNGVLHRFDGPAFVWPEMHEWWVNDARHRLDGPSVIFNNGRVEWITLYSANSMTSSMLPKLHS